MCSEGIVLRDTDGLAAWVTAEARELLARGPAPLTPEEVTLAPVGVRLFDGYWATITLSELHGGE